MPYSSHLLILASALLAGLALANPARAHEGIVGIVMCYGTGHCEQNTCVFGIIVEARATGLTLKVTKTLRGRNVAGQRIRLRNGGWLELYRGTDAPLAAGDAIVVSYHSRTAPPHQPLYLVRSASSDWRTMTVHSGCQGGRNEFEPFVRSGGRTPLLPSPRWQIVFLDAWRSELAGTLLFLLAVGALVRWRWKTARCSGGIASRQATGRSPRIARQHVR